MPKLVFRVSADYEEVIRLRNEIEKLKKELKGMNASQTPHAFNTLNAQLQTSTQRMDELVVEAAKAGAEMEHGFKRKIFDASQVVNGLSEKITLQRGTIQQLKNELTDLKGKYREALKHDGNASELEAKIKIASEKLREQKSALFDLTQEQANARLSVKKLRDEYELFNNDSKETVAATENIGFSLKKAFAVIGGAALGKQFLSDMIRVRGEFQAADTAIQTLLGSKEKADALMSQVREYAKISPLEFSDITQATQMMLGFNIEAEKVPKFIAAIGDVSMGESGKFNSLTLAFSQMSAAGKLMGQDLNQMINAGFNPLQIMSEKTGKSISQLKDEMSRGAISAEMVQQAFIDATSAGGRFYNMSENAAKTINGQLSMMQDAMDAAFNEMGQVSEGVIIKGIQLTTSLIENYETIGKVLVGLVTTYGVYKAATIANIALTHSWAVAAKTDAAAKGIQTLATKAQTVAQHALNAAMKANPYVMAATLIVGVTSALWAFTKNTNQAEEAQQRLNDATSNMRKEIVSEQADIETLFTDLRSAKKGTEEYAQAKDAIINKYGKYLEGLNAEIRTLKDIKGAYDAITLAAQKAARARGKETAMRGAQDAYANLYSGSAGKLYDKLREKVGDVKATSLLNKLQREIGKTGKASKILREEIGNIFRGSSTYGESNAWIKGMENATKTLKDETKKIKVVFGDVEDKNEKTEKNKTTYKQDYEKAKKEWDDAKKELAKIEKDKSKFTSRQYEEARKRRDAAEKNYKDLGGVINTKESGKKKGETERLEKQQSGYYALLDKYKEETIKKKRDNEYEIWQNEIDLMEEGNRKKLAQIELDYDKQISAIEDYEDKLRQEKITSAKTEFEKNPVNKGKVFDATSVDVKMTEQEIMLVRSMRDKADRDRERSVNDLYNTELTAMRDYLKEYGNYQQQKLAITEEYAEKIAKAQTEGERKILNEQQKEALEGLEEKYGKTTRAMADLFEDSSKKSVAAIQAIIDKYELLVAYMSGTDNNGTGKVQIEDLKNVGFSEKDIESIECGEISIKDVTDALKILKGDLADRSPWKTFTSSISNAIKNFKNGEKGCDDFALAIGSIANAVSDFVPTLKQFSSDISNIFGFDDAKIQGAIDAVNGLGQTAAGVGQAISGNIVDGAMAAAGGISKMVSALDGMFGADYSQYNKMVEEYNNLSEIWDEIIDKKQEYIDISYGDEARKVGAEIEDILNKKVESNVALGKERLNSGSSASSNSIGVRQRKGMSSQGWLELLQASREIGFNFSSVANGRMTELFDLTAQQLEQLKEQAPTFWSKLDGDVRNYLDNIIKCNDQIEEMRDRLKETLTGVSFDSFYDNWVSMVTDMSKTNNDMIEDFGKGLSNAILQNMIATKYKDKIQELYDMWAEKFDSNGNGIFDLTEEESQELRDAQKKLANDIIAERDAIAKTFGIDTELSKAQSATVNSTMSITEDTGKAIDGRLTAIQIGQEEGNNITRQGFEQISILNAKFDSFFTMSSKKYTELADNMLDIMASSYLELQEINENTGSSARSLVDINNTLADMKRDLKNKL